MLEKLIQTYINRSVIHVFKKYKTNNTMKRRWLNFIIHSALPDIKRSKSGHFEFKRTHFFFNTQVQPHLPWNMGDALHTLTTPALAYWPRDSSMNTRGIPVMNNIIRNGIKNAPVKKKLQDLTIVSIIKIIPFTFRVMQPIKIDGLSEKLCIWNWEMGHLEQLESYGHDDIS